jgi:D-amino peptidase
MKLYICADIEGVAGVATMDHLSPDGFEYEKAREWMTGEVNAAIEGARAAGVTEFVISDSHGNGQNLLLDDLPDDVRVIRSWPRPLEMMQGLEDGDFCGVFLIGHHTGHTDMTGAIAHTISGAVYEIRLNGEPASETRINAAIAGHLGAPILLATGDEAYHQHVRALLGDVPTVVTKTAYTDYCVQTLTPARSRDLICAAAEAAVKDRQSRVLYRVEGAVSVDMIFKQRAPAQVLSMWPGVEQISATGVRFVARDMEEAVRMVVVATNYDPKSR